MFKQTIRSSNLEDLTRFHDQVRESVQFTQGLDEDGGVLINPIINTDEVASYAMELVIGPDLNQNLNVTVELKDMEISEDFTEEDTSEVE